MTQGIDQALAELKRAPGKPVTAAIAGLVVELRYRGGLVAEVPAHSGSLSYAEAMKAHLARTPVPLKASNFRYPRREELYD